MWHRRLRAALAVFLAVLVAVVYLTVRARRNAAAPPGIERVDPKAATEAPEGAEIVWTDKGREVFTVRFERSLTYEDGRSLLTGVHILVPQEGERSIEVRSREAEIKTPAGQPRSVVLRGEVVVTSSNGLTLRTGEATYDETSKVVRARGAVTFSKGRLSGSGRDAAYDQAADSLAISAPVQMKVRPDEAGGEALDVRAGTATLARREHLVRFERDATVTTDARRLEGDVVTAFLTEDEERITRLELRGHSRVTGAGAAAGALRLMQADDMNLLYGADGRTLQRAELRGQSIVEIGGASPAPRRLRARTIDMEVREDGSTLEQLVANDAVQLELPGEGETAERRIAAQALRGTGAAGEAGLRRMTFTGAVEYRERRPARGAREAIDRLARSDRLDTTLEPGLGAPEEAEFRGRVSIKDGSTTAESGVARYLPARDTMTLETPPGAAGSAPRVADERVSVSAKWIEMTMESRALAAKGDVRSVLRPAPRGGTPAAGPGDPRKLPVMLEDNEPVNVTAAALDYDGARSRATYTGNARLWQGETTIQSEVMVLDDRSGNLSASQHVRTRMLLDDRRAASQPGERAEQVETLGAADQLVYDDAERRATYTGHAHVSGPQGDVTAHRIVMFLEEDGRTLERAEAYENVVARLEGGQRAEGSRLTYYGADERYVMSGTPVKILETVDSGCRETVGSALTFIRSTDTIAVVGTEGNRSRTIPGRCPERAATPPARSDRRVARLRARGDAR